MEQRIITVLKKPKVITFPRVETFWRHLPKWKLKQPEVLLTVLVLAHNWHAAGTANVISCLVRWKGLCCSLCWWSLVKTWVSVRKPREGTARLPGEEAAVLTPSCCCFEVSCCVCSVLPVGRDHGCQYLKGCCCCSAVPSWGCLAPGVLESCTEKHRGWEWVLNVMQVCRSPS